MANMQPKLVNNQDSNDVFDLINTDEDSHEDFITSFDEILEHIENDLFVLEANPNSTNAMNGMIRSLQSLKKLCHEEAFEPFAQFIEPIERMMVQLVQTNAPCCLLLKEAIFLALDHLKFTAESLMHMRQVNLSVLNGITKALCYLVEKTPQERNLEVPKLISYLSGLEVAVVASKMAQVDEPTQTNRIETSKVEIRRVQASLQSYGVEEKISQVEEDLRFFEVLSRTCDLKVSFWRGRTQSILQMAVGINQLLKTPVDESLIKMAALTHDIGMIFIPDHILNKRQKLNMMEEERVRAHVKLGHEIVTRMDAWTEAAEIIAQHHERFDGQGYPAGLQGGEIHLGAKILAVCDTYFSITHLRPDRCHKRSILRAAKEINLHSGSQFDPDIVDAFNNYLRDAYGKSESQCA